MGNLLTREAITSKLSQGGTKAKKIIGRSMVSWLPVMQYCQSDQERKKNNGTKPTARVRVKKITNMYKHIYETTAEVSIAEKGDLWR